MLLNIYFFEGQLHVLFIIIIIQIISPIVHGQKINKADLLVKRFMFGEMRNKRRELQYLMQGCCIKYNNAKDDM